MSAAAKANAAAAAAKAAAEAERQYNEERASSKIEFFPSPEQMEWLKIMVKHKMLDPESVDSDKLLSESSNSIGKVYLIKTTEANQISEFKFGKLVSVTKRSTGLSGLEYTFTDSNGTSFNVSTAVNIEIYSLYKDDLPRHDPRLPDEDKLVVTKPTTEQLKWLLIMSKNELLTPFSQKLTNDNNGTYYLYRDPKTGLLAGGYLFNVEKKTVQMGGQAAPWMDDDHTPSPPKKVFRDVSIYSFYDENGNMENNVRDIDGRIYALPTTLPTHNPLLPEKLVTTPTPDQLKWMEEMMSYVTDNTFKQVAQLTTDNIGTYYLYKQYKDTPLSGGYLFKVNDEEVTVQKGGAVELYDNIEWVKKKLPVYRFYDENENVNMIVRSDKGIVYALPAKLPKTPPKPRSFKRIIDVDDVTGEFTLHDGSTVTFPQDKLSEYFFIQGPRYGESGLYWFSVNNCIDPQQKAYTGKLVTSQLVQSICGDKNPDKTGKRELYIQIQNTTFDTVTTSDTVPPSDTVSTSSSIKPPTTLFKGKKTTTDDAADVESIRDKTKDIQIGVKLCKTRAEPVESVKGPVLPTLNASDENFKKLEGEITHFNPSLHKELDIYIQWGYYLTKAKMVGRSRNPEQLEVQAILDPTVRFLWNKNQIFVLDRDISNAKNVDEVYALRNLKPIPKTQEMSKGDTIYFYLDNDKSKSAILGIIVKKAMLSSTYTVKYKEDGVEKKTEVKASDFYQRDKEAEKNEAEEDKKATAGSSLTGAGKKNKTKRRNIRKSLKKKQSRKSRISRISVKAKFRRSRVRK